MAIMTDAVNVRDAKGRFSELIKRVQLGEEIVIAKAGKPVARSDTIQRSGESSQARRGRGDDHDEIGLR